MRYRVIFAKMQQMASVTIPRNTMGVYVLMQSSLTLHTWSEFSKLVIDVTICGKQLKIRDSLLSQLDTDSVTISSEIL